MATRKDVLKEAITLPPAERAKVVEEILSGLDEPDHAMDELWIGEAEDRLDAYDRGEFKAISLSDILEKYGSR